MKPHPRIRKTIKWVWGSGAALLVIIVSAIVFLVVRSTDTTTLSGHRSWYEGQVREIMAGTLIPDAQGIVRFGGMTINRNGNAVDAAYVRGSAASGWAIFFPHWRGKGANIEGYLYSTVPLSVGGKEVIGPGNMGVTVERVIDPTWSLAAWRLD